MDPTKSKEPETPLKQIRTFQGDVAEAILKQQESLVSIQQAERLKGGSVGSSTSASSEDSKRRRGFFFLLSGGIVLFILGTVGAWYTYNEFVRKTATPTVAMPADRFISANTITDLDLTDASREILINAVSKAKENVEPGEIRHIVLRKTAGDGYPILSTGEFLNILESQAPASLVRAFSPLFMFGALGQSPATNGASSFLIIKLTSFENTFAGMLLWEKSLAGDLGPLFAASNLLKDIIPGLAFTDLTDRNKDIRELLLENQPVLLYSFFDNNMLIITDNIETLRTIFDRLTREKLSR
ncbi:MAG: hypothetical protein Q8Q92_04795 [bacterium]|nr:hypothetical protein [bacterium]